MRARIPSLWLTPLAGRKPTANRAAVFFPLAVVASFMTDDSDPSATLEQWKAEMQAEHEEAIANPDPDDDHRIEGVSQVNYRLYYEYDPEADTLVRQREEQVNDLTDPELRSCSCGVRGMTPEEAREHMRAARKEH
jgi:hypothetical protein